MSDLVVGSFGTTVEIKGATWERDGKDAAAGVMSVRIHYLVNGAPGSRIVLMRSGDLPVNPNVSDEEWTRENLA
jgi:hypothetical protein